ncbi:MAG: hypothetical protein M1281_19650 [Chloroflexi bacterium]|nr:hypothetical protein [Chloroflexota bacterium]
MNIDIGTIALILAVLAFYAKMITAQRRKAVEWRAAHDRAANKKKALKNLPASPPSFGSFSKKKKDWFIGGSGYVIIMLGILMYINTIHTQYQHLWWVPVSLGIVAFSWFFN